MYEISNSRKMPDWMVRTGKRSKKYPFDDMVKGDSFFVPLGIYGDLTKLQSTVSANAAFNGKKKGVQFRTKLTTENEVIGVVVFHCGNKNQCITPENSE